MKLSLIALLSLAPISSHAASAWENATVEATEAYRKDFKAERGQEASEPLGFALERGDDEVITKVYYVDGGKLLSFTYGCHVHGSHFDCHKEDRGTHGVYKRLTNRYKAAEMAKSVGAALELFVRKVGPEASIRTMKFWEAEELLRFSISFEKAGQEFMSCHYHDGAEMDCHRKGNAGPGEPDKKVK